MSSDSAVFLADIIENIERVQDYVQGLDRDNFERDGKTRDAVERCLERISEAAVRLGPTANILMPGQPWNEIRGTGNWLRHAYHRVEPAIIWETLTGDLPSLLDDARAALKRLAP